MRTRGATSGEHRGIAATSTRLFDWRSRFLRGKLTLHLRPLERELDALAEVSERASERKLVRSDRRVARQLFSLATSR